MNEKLGITLTLQADGSVASIIVKPGNYSGRVFKSCIEPILRGVRFPAVEGKSFSMVALLAD